MLVVHVDIQVNPDQVADFVTATVSNATASLAEPGVLRFDLVQDLADPAHLVLVEVYRDAGAALAHKETGHYAVWRDKVAPMMARPRTSIKLDPVFPSGDEKWDSNR